MTAIEKYFLGVLFVMLYKVILAFESVYEILKCDHSNESLLSSALSWCCYAVQQGDSNFESGSNPKKMTTQIKAMEHSLGFLSGCVVFTDNLKTLPCFSSNTNLSFQLASLLSMS